MYASSVLRVGGRNEEGTADKPARGFELSAGILSWALTSFADSILMSRGSGTLEHTQTEVGVYVGVDGVAWWWRGIKSVLRINRR